MGALADSLLQRWTSNRRWIVRTSVVVMVVLGALKLGDEFRRLLWEQGPSGAVDLILRDAFVEGWFAGRPVYRDLEYAIFPPASHLLLWPLAGWLPPTASRWFWAITTLAALAVTLRMVVRDCGAAGHSQRGFVALLLLSMNATGVVIGNGQLILHVMPALVASVLWLRTREPGGRRDLFIAACFVFALVKPSVSAPFFWLLLCAEGGLRPSLLVVLGYACLTLAAAHSQPEGLMALFTGWLANTRAETGGYAEVNSVMRALGWTAQVPLVSSTLLALWGAWVYRHRRLDRWILLGATATFARLWTYHRVYDDVLIFLAEIALFRISRGMGEAGARDPRLADLLLFVTAIAMLCPARLLELPAPVGSLFRGGHALTWAAVLAFLIVRAHPKRSVHPPDHCSPPGPVDPG